MQTIISKSMQRNINRVVASLNTRATISARISEFDKLNRNDLPAGFNLPAVDQCRTQLVAKLQTVAN